MNSYQKLKLKSEARERELLDDIRTLIKGEWIDRQAVIGKYDFIEKFEKTIWAADRQYVADIDGVACFSGIFNETNTNKDETNH